jgi:hypothetical protein
MNENSTDWNRDNRKLKSSAHQMVATWNPDTKYPAIVIMIALTISRNNPRVTMVNGRVKRIRIGFTNNLSRAKTIATITAVPNPSTQIPGSISDKTITAMAVNNNLKISFMMV